MGQKIAQTNQITPELEVFILRYFPQYQFRRLLNNGMSMKSAIITNETDNEPLVMKIYFKPQFTEYEKSIYDSQLEYLKQLINKINHKRFFNVAPILHVEDHFRAGIILRQYYPYNLKERMYSMPYLTPIEKKWISFQLLFAVKELHNSPECHGDIKMENILLTNNTSVFLSDISSYKPAYIQTDDISSYTYYYGSNDNTKSCYLAPERLLDKKDFEAKEGDLFNRQIYMDIFSVGAVIAELFLEEGLFDYTKLLNYKKGVYSVEDSLAKLDNPKLAELLRKMLTLDTSARITIVAALTTFSTDICPIAIPRFLLHYNILITTTRYYKPDMQICFFYKHWSQLWKILFGLSVTAPQLATKPKLKLINKLLLYPPSSRLEMNKVLQKEQNAIIIRGFKCFLPKNTNTHLLYEDILTDESMKMNENEKTLYIIINYIQQAIRNMKYESSTLLAIEMMKHFATRLTHFEVMEMIIPYLVSLLKQTNNLSRLTALHVLIELLYRFDYNTLVLSQNDYDFFDSYVFPSILALYDSGISTLILEFTSVIDKLIDLEEKFLNLTLKSKLLHLATIIQKHKDKDKDKKDDKDRDKDKDEDKEKKKMKRINDIYSSYDSQLFIFKKKLLQIVGEIVSKNEDIDIQQTLIRQFPTLLRFYGLSQINTFGLYVISYFNTKEWIIQREILKNLPMIIPTLGEEVFNSFILPCLEGMVTNNTNELKTLELIGSVNELIKLKFLTANNSFELFKKIIPFIVHPNLWIRDQVIKLVINWIGIISKEKAIVYINHDLLKSYLICPNIVLNDNEEILGENVKEPICRILFEIKLLNIIFIMNEDNELTAALKRILFDDYYGSKANFGDEGNDANEDDSSNMNTINRNSNDRDRDRTAIQIRSNVQSIKSYFEEDYEKYIIKIEERHKTEYELSFLSVILRNLTDLMSDNISLMKAVEETDFNNPEKSFLSQENFNSLFMCKAFNFIFKQDNIHEMITETDIGSQTQIKQFFDESNSVLQRYSSSMNDNDNVTGSGTCNGTNTGTNTSYNTGTGTGTGRQRNRELRRNYYGWRPQGKLITTIYSDTPIERLLPFLNNHFASFNAEGQVSFWKVYESNDEIKCKLALEFDPLPDYTHHSYHNNISQFNNNTSFVGASKNKISKIDPFAQDPNKLETLLTLKDDIDICALKTYNELNDQLIFITEDNVLNVYDYRMESIAQKCPLTKEKGLISSLSSMNCHLMFYLGTLNGWLLSYDYRINRVSESFAYHENTPIISIENYNPFGATIIDIDPYFMNSAKELPECLIINGGANDHEVSLWNINSRRCEILFKVNSSDYAQGVIQTLTVDIPELIPEGKLLLNPNAKVLKECFSTISQYTPHFSSAMTKGILNKDVNRYFYTTSLKRLSKISNVYEGRTTAQKALVLTGCPQFDSSIDYAPFVITAGNDRAIRYWDISKEGFERRSYVVNSPNALSSVYFSTLKFESTHIIQANEIYNSSDVKKPLMGLSEYQNFNGNQFHNIIKNEYSDEMNRSNFCTRVSDASHRGSITDLLAIYSNDKRHLLLSSSLDGSIKIWK